MRKKVKLLLKSAGGLLLAAGLLVGGHVGYLQMTGNFHPVVEGQFYRSAQPGAAALKQYIDTYGIRSVINLRGGKPGKAWYDDEVATAAAAGVSHYDFVMSASRLLPQDEAERLISLMETAEKPLLIHCEAGADRTGLAAALYLASVAKQGEEAAEAQISLKYGHFSIPFLSTSFEMDESFELLENWLGYFES